jgi:hypothetical protein
MYASSRSAHAAPVAQLDRVPDYESGGQRFESSRVHHFPTIYEYESRFTLRFPENHEDCQVLASGDQRDLNQKDLTRVASM